MASSQESRHYAVQGSLAHPAEVRSDVLVHFLLAQYCDIGKTPRINIILVKQELTRTLKLIKGDYHI